MIDQVATNARQIDHGLDAERFEFGARPDAGAHQDGG